MRYHEIISVSDEVHRYIDDMLGDLASAYPTVAAFISGVRFQRSVNNEFDWFSKELRFSTAGLDKGVAEADRWVEAANPPGFMVGHGLQSLIIHEFGHAVDAYIIASGDDTIKNEWFETKKRLETTLGPASKYASKSTREWFAEQFVAEIQGYRPKKLLPVIADFI